LGVYTYTRAYIGYMQPHAPTEQNYILNTNRHTYCRKTQQNFTSPVHTTSYMLRSVLVETCSLCWRG